MKQAGTIRVGRVWCAGVAAAACLIAIAAWSRSLYARDALILRLTNGIPWEFASEKGWLGISNLPVVHLAAAQWSDYQCRMDEHYREVDKELQNMHDHLEKQQAAAQSGGPAPPPLPSTRVFDFVPGAPPYVPEVRQYSLHYAVLTSATGILAAFLAVPVIRTWRRHRLGLCLVCAYDLRASKDRCPECGTPFPTDAEDRKTGQDLKTRSENGSGRSGIDSPQL